MNIDDFSCPICNNIYNDLQNIPRLLMKCGHTYCELCIKRKLEENENIFTCPDDKTVYENIQKIENLPKNLCLLNLIEKAKQKNTIIQSSDISNFKNLMENQNNKEISMINPNKVKCLTPNDISVINFSFMSYSNNQQNFSNSNFSNIDKVLINNEFIPENSSPNILCRNSLSLKNNIPSVNEFNLDVCQIEDEKDKKFCSLHSRRKEIVCIDDKIKICTSCALFGDHKNHNLKSEEDLLKEMFIKSEILIDYFELIDNFSNRIDEIKKEENECLIAQVLERADIVEKNLKIEIRRIFIELRNVLNEKEKQIYFEISENFEENIKKKIVNFSTNISELQNSISNWKNEVKNLLDKLNHVNENSENFLDIVIDDNLHIINAEKILTQYDNIQEYEPNNIMKNLENFKINENFDNFNLNLINSFNFYSPYQKKGEKISKETFVEMQNKSNIEIETLKNQLENYNLGYIELPSYRKNIYENKLKFAIKEESTKFKNSKINLYKDKNNKFEKESTASQQSIGNSNSTLNNNIAMMQTDSSFLSIYDENLLYNNFKEKKSKINNQYKESKKSSTLNITSIDESFKMGQKSKINLDSFINDSFNKKDQITKSKTIQNDKSTYIKKQMSNLDMANFNSFLLGEDGLKLIVEIMNQISTTHNAVLTNSMTLGNINTPLTTSIQIINSKKGMKINEDNTNNRKNNISNQLNNLAKSVNFSDNEMYKIKELRLTKCSISDDGFAILASSLEKPNTVQILNLKGNKIKDKSLKNILNLIKSNKTLKHLNLSQNLISQLKKENLKLNSKILNPNLKLEV